ncbi:MAG TPA: hypothetical protein VFJ85_15445 [Acidimicrobiales bacterium]|nr:hypothetical protein [Acidimicrobiales bacterium]
MDTELRTLLDGAVERRPIGLEDGKSGSLVERVTLAGGDTVVVKHIRPDGDWIMRAMHDEGRAAALWRRGILAKVPPVVDHAVLGVVDDGDGWALVMRDVGDHLIPDGRAVTRAENRRLIAGVCAMHEAFAGAALGGLASLVDRYTVLSRLTPQREPDEGVPRLIGLGWSIFADRVPGDVAGPLLELLDDPTELVEWLAGREQTLVHGDLKIPNVGLSEDRVVLVDWGTQTGMAPAAVEWGWYLAISAGRIEATREEILDDVRAAEGERHDAAALQAALLGAFLQLGWNKALDAHEHPDPAVRAREEEDLAWWVRKARGALDAWPPD